LTYGIKILSTFGLLLNTAISLPFFNILIVAIYCNEKSPISENLTCYSGIYFVYLVLGVLGALFMALFSVIFTVLYIDLNPSSTIPFACP
jgi:branched-subunit amino acid permease